MRAFIFEQNYFGGHYLPYIAHTIPALTTYADEVVVGLPRNALSSDQYKAYLAPIESQFRFHEIPERFNGSAILQAFHRARTIRSAIAAVKPDVFYMLTGDGYHEAIALGMLGGYRVIPQNVHSETVILRNAVAYELNEKRQPAWAVSLALRASPWNVVHFIDPVVFQWSQQTLDQRTAARCRFTPEPIVLGSPLNQAECRTKLGLPTGCRVMAAVGMQCPRKGTDLLLSAFEVAVASTLAPHDVLVVAGPQTADVKAALSGRYAPLVASGRLVAFDRYLSQDELNTFYSVADVVICPYRPAPQPSAVCLQAAASNRLLLTADTCWFAHMVPKYDLGLMCDVIDRNVFATRMREALDAAPSHQRSQACAEMLAEHSPSRFAANILRGLSEGRP